MLWSVGSNANKRQHERRSQSSDPLDRIAVISKDDRLKALTQAAQQPIHVELISFRGGYEAFPVVRLPLEIPILRAANGRLAVRKAAYVRMKGLPADYFERGEEQPEIQAVLQKMLVELARKPEAAIYQELERSRVQTEHILLSCDGIVVDGNRRLASMRVLYEQDSVTFRRFAQVEAVLLPEDASKADIEMVEAARQMAPDTKLAYGWIERRIKLRHHRDELGLPPRTICESYRIPSLESLNAEIEELSLSEEYLAEYLGDPGNYGAIEDAEEFFIGLRQQLARLKDPGAVNIWRLVGFALIKEATALRIRAEQYFPFVPSQPPYAPRPVLELFGAECGIWAYSSDLGSGATLESSHYRDLAPLLKRSERSRETAEGIIRLFDQLRADEGNRPHPIALLNRLRQVNRMLAGVDLEVFTERQRKEFRGGLVEASYHCQNLMRAEGPQTGESLSSPTMFHRLVPLLKRFRRFILQMGKRDRER